MLKICPKHGLTEFFYSENEKYFRCKQCRIDSVIDKRRKNKIELVKYKGGKCEICGYNKCIEALEFHHFNREEKDFSISCGNNKSLSKLKEEADKCMLLCSNCHREIHSLIEEEKRQQKMNEIRNSIDDFEQNFGKINLHKHCHNSITIDMNKLIELIEQKKNREEIADYFGVSRSTIVRFMNKHNIDHRTKPKLEFYTKDILKADLLEIGTFEGIGRKYNVTGASIKNWCIRHDLPSRIKDLIEKINNDNL